MAFTDEEKAIQEGVVMADPLEMFVCLECNKKFWSSDFTVNLFDESSDIELEVTCCFQVYSSWVEASSFYIQD